MLAAPGCHAFPLTKVSIMNLSHAIRLTAPAWSNRDESLDINQALARWICSPGMLLLCKFTIGLVSAYDVYLTIKYVDSLPFMELNPIGRWLMMLDAGPECQLSQIAAFIASKFAGNFIAICVIELLASWKRTTASIVAVGVASFQLLLLYFLIFGDMST